MTFHTFFRGAARRAGLTPVVRYLRTGFNYTRRRRVDGGTFLIPRINGLQHQPSEPWMLQVLAKLLPLTPGAFLDVGVNVGQTLLKVKATDPGRAWVGFEPNPSCVFYTQELIRANRLRDCTLLPVGLFGREDVLRLNLFGDDSTDSSASMIPDFRSLDSVAGQVFVPVFRWSAVGVVASQRFGIVKIDVEGAELDVVETILPMLQRDRPLLLVEVLPAYAIASRIERQRELEDILRQLDYEIIRVLKSPSEALAGFQRLTSIGIHSDTRLCEYLMAPREKLDLVLATRPVGGLPGAPICA